MLTYKQTDSLEVIGYFYLDFASYINTRKSTSSYVFMLTSGAIFWSNKKQTLTATSSIKYEGYVCFLFWGYLTWCIVEEFYTKV